MSDSFISRLKEFLSTLDYSQMRLFVSLLIDLEIYLNE